LGGLGGVLLLLSFALICWPASAEMLDRVDLRRSGDIVVIQVHLTRDVRYTKHFPLDHGALLHIYFDEVSLDPVGRPQRPGTPESSSRYSNEPEPMHEEHMRSPPTKLIPFFWVSYMNHGTHDFALDPFHIVLQFSEPVSYSVRAEEDNRTFSIYVPITHVDSPPAAAPSVSPKKVESVEQPASPAPPVAEDKGATDQ
jgi:hypothetical protein